jgi:hypothetical protein
MQSAQGHSSMAKEEGSQASRKHAQQDGAKQSAGASKQ